MNNQGLPGLYIGGESTLYKTKIPSSQQNKYIKINSKRPWWKQIARCRRKNVKRQKKIYKLLRVRNYIHNAKTESNEKRRE